MSRKCMTLTVFVFAVLVFVGTLAVGASAQTGGRVVVRRAITRPIVVRRHISPYWGYRNYWGYSSYYDPYWNTPYLQYQDRKFMLERELAGNLRELSKHRVKYRADGYIPDKERRELDDDVRDVQRSRQKLYDFVRRYEVRY